MQRLRSACLRGTRVLALMACILIPATTGYIAVARSHPPSQSWSSEFAPQAERAPISLPSSVRKANGDFLWRSGSFVLDEQGRLAASTPSKVRSLLRDSETGECVRQLALVDVWDVDNTYPSTLAEFVDRATAVLLGRVVGIEGGFTESGYAGLMLEVAVDAVAKANPDYNLRTVFVFYPAGEVRIGSYRICRENNSLPAPPAIGDEVVLAPRRPPIDPNYPIVALLGSGVEIAFGNAERMMTPRGLENVPELNREGGDFASFSRQVKALTGLPVER